MKDGDEIEKRQLVRDGKGTTEDLTSLKTLRDEHAKRRKNAILAWDGLLAPTKNPLKAARRDRVGRGVVENDDLELLQKKRILRSGFIIRARMVDDSAIGEMMNKSKIERRFSEGNGTDRRMTRESLIHRGRRRSIAGQRPNSSIENRRIISLPIWVGQPEFPVHLWCPEIFSAVGSVIGEPVRLDAHTAIGPNGVGAKMLTVKQ